MAIATATALAAAGTAAAVGGAINDRNISKANIKSAERQRAQSQKFIEESVAKGRADLFKMFSGASESRRQGVEGGLSLLMETIPNQLKTFQEGNMNAQNQIVQAHPQRVAALTGGLVNYTPQAAGVQAPGLTLPELPQGGLSNA